MEDDMSKWFWGLVGVAGMAAGAGEAAAQVLGAGGDPFQTLESKGSQIITFILWGCRAVAIVALFVALGTVLVNKANKMWIISCVVVMVIFGSASMWISWSGINSSSVTIPSRI
jgi:hypothetical protein